MPTHSRSPGVTLSPRQFDIPEALEQDARQDAAPKLTFELVPATGLRGTAAGTSTTANALVGPDVFTSPFDFARIASEPAATLTAPAVEPMESFIAWRKTAAKIRETGPGLADINRLLTGLPKRVDHRRWHLDFVQPQGARGTCWAFAATAALEAAYARQGTRVKLSEHYLFHLSKAHELQRAGPGIHSLVGFQGNCDAVHHLTFWRVPPYPLAAYIDQAPLQALANSIPETGNALNAGGGGTVAQADWFEFDQRHIPLAARWHAIYGAATFGRLTNYSLQDLKKVLAAGYDVVIDVSVAGGGGHTILAYGYDDHAGTLLIKNSWGAPGFGTMLQQGDPNFTLSTWSAFYITSVRPPQTFWPAMWLGRWEIDHDGWRGRLVLRRYLAVHDDKGLPAPQGPIALGTWYGEDGRELPVTGGFVDGGRGLHCKIGTQPFEIYLHGRDPWRAAGRCKWDGKWFGVVLTRGAAGGAGYDFARSETIGIWDMIHDGWRGEARLGVEPSYRQAADGVARKAWIAPGAIAHEVDFHIDFGPANRDQRFQLLHHTREDGVIGGVTTWGGRTWPVEARMSANLYLIAADGALRWYRHTGRYDRAFRWDAPMKVGTGWNGFTKVFGGGDGVVYAIKSDGKLLWYFHDGRNQGTFDWRGPTEVGTGWNGFRDVFAAQGGVIYAIRNDGALLWYRHVGHRDGSRRWQGPLQVGTGWQVFTEVAAGADGAIYAIRADGRLTWYRHFGQDRGYGLWDGGRDIGTGWQDYDRLLAAGNGFLYGRNRRNNELWSWRHHGFQSGSSDFTPGAKVGTGWGGADVRGLLLT